MFLETMPLSLREKLSRLLAAIVPRQRYILAALLAMLVSAGAAYSVLLGSRLRYHDETEYYTLARNLVTTRSFTYDGVRPTAFRPPGYPFLLSLLVGAGADIVTLRMLSFVALAGCAYLTYATLRSQRDVLSGIVGACLTVFYPLFFYTAGTLYPQIVGSFLLLLSLHVHLSHTQHPAWVHVLAGVSFGLLLLTIPTFIFALFVITAHTLVFDANSRRKAAAILMCLVALGMAGSWSMRNYYLFGRFVFGSANGGLNLLLGNSEHATANGGVATDISAYAGASGNELQVDAYYQAQAIRYMTSHKRETAALYAKKVVNYFNYRNVLATRSEASRLKDMLMLLTYAPLLLLLIVRLLWQRSVPLLPFERLLGLLYLSNAFYAAVFFTRIRLRVPFDFLLIMLAASFIGQLALQTAGRPLGQRRGGGRSAEA